MRWGRWLFSERLHHTNALIIAILRGDAELVFAFHGLVVLLFVVLRKLRETRSIKERIELLAGGILDESEVLLAVALDDAVQAFALGEASGPAGEQLEVNVQFRVGEERAEELVAQLLGKGLVTCEVLAEYVADRARFGGLLSGTCLFVLISQ